MHWFDWEGREYQRNTEFHLFFYAFLEKTGMKLSHVFYNGFCAWASCSFDFASVPQAKPWGQEVAWLMFKDVGSHCQNIQHGPRSKSLLIHLSWSSQKAAACEISWYICFNVAVCYVLLSLLVWFAKTNPNQTLKSSKTWSFRSVNRGIPKNMVRMARDPTAFGATWSGLILDILSQPGFASSFRWLRKEACIFRVL